MKPLPEWGPADQENRIEQYLREEPLTPSWTLMGGERHFVFSLPPTIKSHIMIPTPLSGSRTSVYIGGSRKDLRTVGGGSKPDLRILTMKAAQKRDSDYSLTVPTVTYEQTPSPEEPSNGARDMICLQPLKGDESKV